MSEQPTPLEIPRAANPMQAVVMQDAPVSPARMREKAEHLWCLLDDISTAGDVLKPDLTDPFVKYVLRKCEERSVDFQSDGYRLFVTA